MGISGNILGVKIDAERGTEGEQKFEIGAGRDSTVQHSHDSEFILSDGTISGLNCRTEPHRD